MFSKNLLICLDLKLQHKVLHLNDIDGAKTSVSVAIETSSILAQKKIDGAKMIFTADYTVAQ